MYAYLLTRRRIILFLAFLGILSGFYALSQLYIKLYPDIAKPVIQVHIPHPSFTAVDFLDSYKTTLDSAIDSIDGVEQVEITSRNSRTFIILSFDYGLNAELMKTEVQSAFDNIKTRLPSESDNYSVRYWTQTVSELDIALFSSEIDERELYEIAKPVVEDVMSGLEDADEVSILNIEELRATLTLDEQALFSYGLEVDEVINTIKTEYKNLSIGSIRTDAGEYTLRVRKNIDTLFDIQNILISYSIGKTIFLKDIADVVIDYGYPRNLYRVDGNRAVIIYITPKPDGNVNRLSADAHKALEEVLAELPDHVRSVTVLDPATFITRSVNNVVQSAILGAFLAVFCIVLLIGEAKNSIIVATSLPLSVIINFTLMAIFDVSINIISLSGLALAVGMIVDASIVVMENIYRHIETTQLKQLKGKKYVNLIGNSVREVVPSIIGSTITSVCVFIPLSFTSQLTASILGDLAKTVVFTLSCSLLVAIFVVPLVAYYVFRQRKRNKKQFELTTLNNTSKTKRKNLKEFSDTLVVSLFNVYKKALERLLSKRKNTYIFISCSVALLVFCFLILFPRITKEIIAPPQSNMLLASVSHSEIEDQQEFSDALAPLEQDLQTNYPGMVKKIFINITRWGYASIIVTLDSSKSLPYMINTLTEKFPSEDPWDYTFSSWDPAAMPIPATYGLHVRVEGPDRMTIFAIEDQVADIINNSNFYGRVRVTPSTRLTNEIALYPRTQAFGVIPEYSVNRIVSILQSLINGALVVQMTVDDSEMDIYLENAEEVNSIKDIEGYMLPYNGKTIPVKHFFDFEETQGINELYSVDGKESYNIFVSMKVGEPAWKQRIYETEIKKRIAEEIEVPKGYRIIFEDTQEVINESIHSLVGALILSILLIYIVLGIQFNSLRIPLLILVTIPFGFIGVIISLFIFKSTVSLNSMLGVILLAGIVVNNAIILIDFYLKERENYNTKIEAILEACRLRFRPILITTFTTILGMLPIAFAIGDGANIIQPLGIAVSGGLAFSTFFTLFMIPSLLNCINFKNQKKKFLP